MQSTPDANHDTKALRWAGIGVAVSGFMLVITIGIFGGVLGSATPSEPGLEVTLVDKANHLQSNWHLASALWATETFLFVLLAISSLVIAPDSRGGAALFPRRAAWTTVGIGSILQASMYTFMLGGYPAAMDAVQSTPALFNVLNGSAYFLFYLGNTAIFLGFAGLFWTEVSVGEVVSRRVGWIGSVTCLATMVLLLAVAGKFVSIMIAAPFALIAHVLIGYFGVALLRTTGSSAIKRSDATVAETS